jgi:hypothetical protein
MWRLAAATTIVVIIAAPVARAQSPSQPVVDGQAVDSDQGPDSVHEHHHVHGGQDATMPMSGARAASGTAWLPDLTPMYAVHAQQGPWQLMLHENVFVQYLTDSSGRAADQFGSINWVMGMAAREVGSGHVSLTGMFSAEPWTIGGCGYPDLLASGELCQGEKIHDRQHPHDLVMELAGEYDAPLRGSTRWQVYGGPAGEPALGPVAYPHRPSALPNPLAPITHHWLDSTHVAFGVVTGGLYGRRWKAEASVFNGREPDEHRADFDFGALDSVSARFWFLPTANLAMQISAGRLTEAEATEHSGARSDVTRVTASATYHAAVGARGFWASTVAWGHNREPGVGTNGLLVESTLTLADRDTWFGRLEIVGKTAHDLNVPELDAADDVFAVQKLQGGYTRYFPAWKGFKAGIGASVSAGFVPGSLEPVYGGRVNTSFGMFLTVRPAGAGVSMTHAAVAAPSGMPPGRYTAPVAREE